MRYAAFLMVAVLAIGLIGCAQEPAWRVIGAEMTEAGTALFTAKGEAPCVDAEDAVVVAKARVAAATMAKANLLEKIKGAVVSGNVTVGDLMFKNQAAATMVRGYLSRATIVFEEAPRGMTPEIIVAIASLELDPADYAELAKYVE